MLCGRIKELIYPLLLQRMLSLKRKSDSWVNLFNEIESDFLGFVRHITTKVYFLILTINVKNILRYLNFLHF